MQNQSSKYKNLNVVNFYQTPRWPILEAIVQDPFQFDCLHWWIWCLCTRTQY